jgi:DNA mismatch repair ATPase MutS
MFRVRPPLCDDVRRYLESVEDASRIVQKFLLGRGDSDDLVAIKRTIQVWEALKMRLLSEKLHEVKHERPQSHDEWSSVDALMSKMADLSYLANRIDAVLEDNSNAKTVESDQIIAEESVELNSSNESDETNSEWTIKPQ